jgi:hypothetical protein
MAQQRKRRPTSQYTGSRKQPRARKTQRQPAAANAPLVERAWVPLIDAWSATANGTAAVVCRKPDGRCAGALFQISLIEGGLTHAIDQLDAEPGGFERMMEELSSNGMIRPYEEAPVEVASAFIWGAYALALEHGYDWDLDDEIGDSLALVPRPPGEPGDWADQVWNDSIPTDLRQILEALPFSPDWPKGKELLVRTTAVFDLTDAPHAIEAIRSAAPDFVPNPTPPPCDGERNVHFAATRRPREGRGGGRKTIGRVEVCPEEFGPHLVVQCDTLSMACAVIHRLKSLLGESVVFSDAHWENANDLMRDGEFR